MHLHDNVISNASIGLQIGLDVYCLLIIVIALHGGQLIEMLLNKFEHNFELRKFFAMTDVTSQFSPHSLD